MFYKSNFTPKATAFGGQTIGSTQQESDSTPLKSANPETHFGSETQNTNGLFSADQQYQKKLMDRIAARQKRLPSLRSHIPAGESITPLNRDRVQEGNNLFTFEGLPTESDEKPGFQTMRTYNG